MLSINSGHLRSSDDAALYNIGVVSRMTGIPVATLRVWERRYDFPSSDRTRGGHRIYSEREVERLRWVKARIDEGMQTGQAIRALQYLEERGEASPPPSPSAPEQSRDTTPALADAAIETLQARFAQALLDHDLAGADRILAEVLAIYPLEDLILDLIRPSLVTIGQGWIDGEVSVATEHMASHFVRQRLLSWLDSGPSPRPVPPTVLACAPNDWHEVSLLMLGVLLRRQGWPVHYLGPSVPLPDLASFVRTARPAAVVLVAMLPESARALLAWPEHMPELAERGKPPVCFAGRGFTAEPDLLASMPGQFLGSSLESGFAQLLRILGETTGSRAG